jgi:hybrid cluster-associated redox disulfide protein
MAPYTGDMPIKDVLTSLPGAARVFEAHGLGCAGCLAAELETLDSVAVMHDIAVDDLLRDLNRLAAADTGVTHD